ncbi:hypothetical protein XA68_13076 [Ophiocordyceps unilateralis]|uniref:O-methylsterigmatocystin oxidoreductase n=1 Tax=Ophiocordyceps unilateralis TaxID=268505 RepID=A0A2A9PD01_OPHUN|nr:hypothetical protein XA68_13076 [Ophiocordyceps unilateralis]
MTQKLLFRGIFVLLGIVVYYGCFRKTAARKLPPGPKPLPLVGNINHLPPKGAPEYLHWLKHRERFGPISSVTAFGETAVILHDRQATHELLEKMTKKTSGRPLMEFANQLCGFNRLISGKQFDETCKWHRRLMHKQFGSKSIVARYHDIVEAEAKVLLWRIWREPENLMKLLKIATGAIILKVTYGYTIDRDNVDPLVDLIDQMMNNFSDAFTAMTWPVDLIPAIQYLPSFLPGMGFKKTAVRWKRITTVTADIPYSFVQKQIKTANPRPSYVARLLQEYSSSDTKGQVDDAAEEAIKNSAAVLFGGGADTTSSSLSSFILAMTLFPDVQRRAQQEIDGVVGSRRLPRPDDRPNMPYTEGIVAEALRWLPVVPIGTAHRASEEAVCKDYVIPKGAQILPSIWWFTHDPEVYHEPDKFDPERYASRNEPDPRSVVFGFGRRMCPGQYFADANLFLIISHILSVFNIRKDVDENGVEMETKVEMTPGLISYPVKFPYRIRPRDAEREHLLRRIEAENPGEKTDASLVREEIAAQLRD